MFGTLLEFHHQSEPDIQISNISFYNSFKDDKPGMEDILICFIQLNQAVSPFVMALHIKFLVKNIHLFSRFNIVTECAFDAINSDH